MENQSPHPNTHGLKSETPELVQPGAQDPACQQPVSDDANPGEGSITRSDQDYVLKMRLSAGLLGSLFGADSNAATNIAGITVIGMWIVCIILLFIDEPHKLDIFKIAVIPIIGMALGFIFGRNSAR